MFFSKKIVGVDIGTSSIKIVEISDRNNFKKLENYGQVESNAIQKELMTQPKPGSIIPGDIASLVIKQILEEAKIKTKNAIFSVPDFFTFCTSFDIPPMTPKEIPGAIRYSASQYLTLPISEVTLDWKIMSNTKDNKSPLKVFIVAMPNQVVEDFKKIAKDAGLELYALEAEVFGIARSLLRENKKTICLVDIGTQSSTLNIVDSGFLKRSYSLNLNNKEGDLQNLDYFKSVLDEVSNISSEFIQSEQKQIEEIYLTGGRANLPGLKEYFAKNLSKSVFVPNCFSGLSHLKILDQTLSEMSPSFSAAVGVALDGLEI